MNPPKYLVRWKKHRFTFALNETEVWVVAGITAWATKDTWVLAKIRGENTNEDVIGQINGYKVDVRDKTIYIVFDALAGEQHAEALLTAYMKGEYVKVEIEETEAPYDMAKRTKRATRATNKTTWTTQERPRAIVHTSPSESDM